MDIAIGRKIISWVTYILPHSTDLKGHGLQFTAIYNMLRLSKIRQNILKLVPLGELPRELIKY